MNSDSENSLPFALFRAFRVATTFLTTLPVGRLTDVSAQDQRWSVYCYPLTGLLVGCLLWLFYRLLPADIMANQLLWAMLVLTAWTAITGALHLDGLADCADAWIGGLGDRDKTLRIMKDPTAGPVAVITLVLVIGLKLAALVALFDAGFSAFLLVIPMLSRATPMLLFASTSYIRRGGIGEDMRPLAADKNLLLAACGSSVLLAVLLLGVCALAVLIAMAVIFILLRRATVQRLQGFTGDIAGAMIEFCETVALVVLAVICSAG